MGTALASATFSANSASSGANKRMVCRPRRCWPARSSSTASPPSSRPPSSPSSRPSAQQRPPTAAHCSARQPRGQRRFVHRAGRHRHRLGDGRAWPVVTCDVLGADLADRRADCSDLDGVRRGAVPDIRPVPAGADRRAGAVSMGFRRRGATVDVHAVNPLAEADDSWKHSSGQWLLDMAF